MSESDARDIETIFHHCWKCDGFEEIDRPELDALEAKVQLYKWAAEQWAMFKTCTGKYDEGWCCQTFKRDETTHAADCKAARILNLKMEEQTPDRIWYNDTPESEREYYDTRKGWDDARCEHCGEPFWGYERDEACDRCKDMVRDVRALPMTTWGG